MPLRGGYNRSPKARRHTDADAPDHAAHHDVPQHRLLAVSVTARSASGPWERGGRSLLGSEVEHDGERRGDEHADVHQEARCDEELLEFPDLAY